MKSKASFSTILNFSLFASVCLILIYLYLFLFGNLPEDSDEGAYVPLIYNYIHHVNPLPIIKGISVFPTYFYLISIIARPIGDTIPIFRGLAIFVTILTLFFAFILFYFLRPNIWRIRFLQFFFFPIFFPLYFLIYSDIASLGLNLLTFLFVHKRHYFLAGVFSILSLSFRQDNIAMLIFFCLYIYFKEYKLKDWQINCIEYLKKICIFVIGILLFLLWMIYNKGAIAFGDQKAHPLSLHPGNIYFFIFLFFILFLPLNLYLIPQIYQFFKRCPLIVGAIVLLASTFFLYNPDHPFNKPVPHEFFIHNMLLRLMTANFLNRLIVIISLTFGTLSLIVINFKDKKNYLIYITSIIALSSEWLIEPRYMIPLFAFFMLLRPSYNRKIEYLILILNIELSLILLNGTLLFKIFI